MHIVQEIFPKPPGTSEPKGGVISTVENPTFIYFHDIKIRNVFMIILILDSFSYYREYETDDISQMHHPS
ncbi:MAG: hypothetical protein ACUVTL_10010 [Thermoproteota archaeon]